MGPVVETKGEFAGWKFWPGDPFESEMVGPFYYKKDENGQPVTAFRASEKHMNGLGFMHGGCMMTFADFSLFAIADDLFDDQTSAVTLSMNSEFLSSAQKGALMEVRGEVLKAGRSIIFIRGVMTADGEPCLNFSGTIKKIKRPAA